MKKRIVRYIIILFAMIVNTSAFAITIDINESLINKYAEEVGSVSGNGRYSALSATGRWNWTISRVTFDIKEGHITYTGVLNASFIGVESITGIRIGPLYYSTRVNGNANLRIVNNNRIKFELNEISIPIRFNILNQTITVTNIRMILPYGMNLPLYGLILNTGSQSGNRPIQSAFHNLSKTVVDDKIRIRANIIFW